MKIQDSEKREMPMPTAEPQEFPDLGALCDGHIAREFADFDVDATMETMVPEPSVHCVAVMTGGSGGEGVRRGSPSAILTEDERPVRRLSVCVYGEAVKVGDWGVTENAHLSVAFLPRARHFFSGSGAVVGERAVPVPPASGRVRKIAPNCPKKGCKCTNSGL